MRYLRAVEGLTHDPWDFQGSPDKSGSTGEGVEKTDSPRGAEGQAFAKLFTRIRFFRLQLLYKILGRRRSKTMAKGSILASNSGLRKDVTENLS